MAKTQASKLLVTRQMDLSIFSFYNTGQIRRPVLFFSFLINMQEIR